MTKVSLVGLLALVVAASSFVFVVVLVGNTAQKDCLRDHRTITALRTIIERSKDTTAKYHTEGLLTTQQYQRALEENAFALNQLRLPQC